MQSVLLHLKLSVICYKEPTVLWKWRKGVLQNTWMNQTKSRNVISKAATESELQSLFLNSFNFHTQFHTHTHWTNLWTRSLLCTCPPPSAVLYCRLSLKWWGRSCRSCGCASGRACSRWAPETSTACGRSYHSLEGKQKVITSAKVRIEGLRLINWGEYFHLTPGVILKGLAGSLCVLARRVINSLGQHCPLNVTRAQASSFLSIAHGMGVTLNL